MTTEITITAQLAIEKLLDSYDLFKQGFKTLDEHLAFCQAIRTLFGEDIYHNVISQEAHKEAMKKYPQD